MPDPQQPTLSQAFNKLEVSKYADAIAMVSTRVGQYYFDFTLRAVYAPHTTIPFMHMDREVLVEVHDRLVRLGGNPPPLPAEQQATTPARRGLNP